MGRLASSPQEKAHKGKKKKEGKMDWLDSMAGTFLSNITERVLSKVSSLVLDEISLAWNVKSELKKLQSTLSTIKAVLLDADDQQAKNHEVRDWLEKLKDVVYDIEDLLDKLYTQVLRLRRRKNGGLLGKVTNNFSCSIPILYGYKIGQKIADIRQRLDDIAVDRKNFHFTEDVQRNRVVENRGREQTHSFVRASDIVGREHDKEFILELLLSSADQENVSVIPIVGLGGLGKTTLVKLVYNDNAVVQNFQIRMWICMSEDLSLSKVIEKILKSATGESYGDLDMDQMQRKLHDVLIAKRYLLVLDDAWNEDRNRWMDLKELLMNCSVGSKIIVTTRSKMVAKITGTVSPYNLSGLSDADAFSLFLKCAFRGPEDWLPNLVEIGREIVKKCHGVPLAVKTLGSLLYMKTQEQEWLHIRDNDIWKIEQKPSDILPILSLSYEQMPSHLRQCFAYCSLFPKGYEIPREAFINLWIGLGLVSTDGNQESEIVGNQYFNELLSRFCFQDVVEAFDGEILACRIHNLVHDLAQSVSAAECLNAKSSTKNISEKVRHILFHSEDTVNAGFPQSLLGLRKLRSFCSSLKAGAVDKTFVKTITLNFRCLRILMLNSLELEKLPSSIGNLKQLRFLDLSHCFTLKFLPVSICKLVNLQTLNLINCEQLQGLPENFGELISLKTLYLTSEQVSIKKKDSPSFKSLQFLLLYRCYCRKLPSEVFQQFTALRVLRIYHCSRLTSLPSSIKHLAALEKLWIWDCEELNLLEGEGMEGLTSLCSLLLMGLPKLVTLPMGLKETAAASLRYLRIANCPSLQTLPGWLQNFTSLVRLYIEDCHSLSSLPEGIHNIGAKIHISDCPQIGQGC